jgi:ribonuclease BN (tRNA processing enzyme)
METGLTHEEEGRDTGMSLLFLGTGAGRATPRRSNTATALRRGSQAYLFDAGEGVQMQLMLSKMKGTQIKKIFSECEWSF